MPPAPPDPRAFADAWAVLLRTPLAADAVDWRAEEAPGPTVEWRSPPADAGWLLRLGDGMSAGPALFVRTAQQSRPTEARVQTVAALCRAAWRLQCGGEPPAVSQVVSDAIHGLRNALNSTGMNAAVLARHKALPTELRTHATLVDDGATRSGDALHHLCTLLDVLR